MIPINDHINPEHKLNDQIENLIGSSKPAFRESKEDVWNKLELNLEALPIEKEAKVIKLEWFRYAAAAAIMALLCSTLVARFYSIDVLTGSGQHFSEVLPDGSEVILNAGSSLSYHPYWWVINRVVNFEGEGFFSVENGERFSVVSNNGTTDVLGTSFNVNSRGGSYEVLCITGLVRVSNSLGSVKIAPNEFAISSQNGNFEQSVIRNEDEVIGWIQNKFFFAGVPLNEVLREVELQYGVLIQFSDDYSSQMAYSGYFNKSENVDEVLGVIGQALGLSFVKHGASTYNVSQVN